MTAFAPATRLGQRLVAVIAFAAVSVVIGASWAGERVTEFVSDIRIDRDGGVGVTETIAMVAEAGVVDYGIVRVLPASRRMRAGNAARAGYEIIAVSRDGAPEPYRVVPSRDGVGIVIGDEETPLAPGPHVYVVSYRARRLLGYFADYDAFDWDIVGTAWPYPIDRLAVTIALPGGTQAIEVETAKTVTVGHEPGMIDFSAETPLAPGQGFVIRVTWPKGYVAAPRGVDAVVDALGDRTSLVAALAGLIAVAGFLLVARHRLRRQAGTARASPTLAAPEGLSPSALRYLHVMGIDDTAFIAALVDMAVKGYLVIDEDRRGAVALRRGGADDAALAADEALIAAKLFADGDRIGLIRRDRRTIDAAFTALKTHLASTYGDAYFRRAALAITITLTLALLSLAGIALGAGYPANSAFSLLWLSLWTLATLALARRASKAWKRRRALGATLLAVAMILATWFGFAMASIDVAPMAVGLLMLTVIIAGAMIPGLKAPTTDKRALFARIRAYRDHLRGAAAASGVAESLLPDAIALGVDPGGRGRPGAWRWFSSQRSGQDEALDIAAFLGRHLSRVLGAPAPRGSTRPGGGGDGRD